MILLPRENTFGPFKIQIVVMSSSSLSPEEKKETKMDSLWKRLGKIDEATFYAGMQFGALGFSVAYLLNYLQIINGVPVQQRHSPFVFTLVGAVGGMGAVGKGQHNQVRTMKRRFDAERNEEIIQETGRVSATPVLTTLMTHQQPHPQPARTEPSGNSWISLAKTAVWGYVAVVTMPVLVVTSACFGVIAIALMVK